MFASLSGIDGEKKIRLQEARLRRIPAQARFLVGGDKKDWGGDSERCLAIAAPFPRLRGTANKGKPLHLRAVTLTRIKRVWGKEGGV